MRVRVGPPQSPHRVQPLAVRPLASRVCPVPYAAPIAYRIPGDRGTKLGFAGNRVGAGSIVGF